jgi:2-oxoisovalerate dehydrogenase E1 component alpha subunit
VQPPDYEAMWARFDARRSALGLSSEDLREIYRLLVTARLADARLTGLRGRGLVAGGASCFGHEAAQVGCALPIQVGNDYILPYYRDLGVMLTIGVPIRDVLLNYLGRASDPISGGRGRPAQWNSRALKVVSGSGLVATQTLHAAGIAFAARLRGEPSVAVTFFGEGATSEGDFHEALNFAGLHRLGVVFVCENNGIALSTPQSRQMAAQHVADRAAGYGMPGVVVDGSDVLAVLEAAREAFARARSGQGPTLLEVLVPRLKPGEASDPAGAMRDPVALFYEYLVARGELTDAAPLHRQISDEIEAAEAAALAAPEPDPATIEAHLFASHDTESQISTNPGQEVR